MDAGVITTDSAELWTRYQSAVPAPARRAVLLLVRAATESGALLYLVGGPVRDLMLDVGGLDIDLALEGDLDGLCARVPDDWDVTRHPTFMTATFRTPDGTKIDVAVTRREHYARPAALPLVEPAPIDEDLWRRDISINALALPLRTRGFGAVIDPTGGASDLERGVARALHERSFRDDPTRLFRVLRFAGRFDLRIEPRTQRWMTEAVAEGGPARLSRLRLSREVRLILAEPDPIPALRLLRRFDLDRAAHAEFRAVAPGLAALRRLDDDLDRAGNDADRSAVRAAALAAVLLPSCSEDDTREFLLDLGVGAESADRLARDRARLPTVAERLRATQAARRSFDRGTFHDLDLLSPEGRALLAATAKGHRVRNALRWYEQRRRELPAMIGGKALLKLGCPPGPTVGRLLGELRGAMIDGTVATREEQIDWVRARLAAGGA